MIQQLNLTYGGAYNTNRNDSFGKFEAIFSQCTACHCLCLSLMTYPYILSVPPSNLFSYIIFIYISTIFEASLLLIDYPNFPLPLLEAGSFAFFGLQLDIIEIKIVSIYSLL